ncbi:MAG: HAD-IIIA family hydrolase [Candidatus Methanogranum gryphiswaldense]|jgi:D-sedoheptulose 7-phosphate isomerase|nr:MAG: HAD-IIIA family hydrolase [Candidatus Methanogranum sp. U3.2.1]
MNDLILAELKRSSEVIANIDPVHIRKAADMVLDSVRQGGQIIFMGNGGSSADAQHIAAEFSGKYAFDRPAMAGVCLSNIAPVTAIGNDYSYDLVFKRQIEAICRKGDIVVGLSTSGNSKNVILAMEAAKKKGAKTISFTGDQGKMREMADLAVIIPTKETPRVQEGYLVACHTMCGIVEREMYGEKTVLVDRDGTIVMDVPYCADPDKIQLLPGSAKGIKQLNDAGYKVIVVTNQSGIGRGLVTHEDLAKVHERLCQLIEAEGGHLDGIYYCPHHPDDNCGCRKPAIGMGEKVFIEHPINPTASYMIGDFDRDVQFGMKLGLKTFLVDEKFTFVEAVKEILKD